LNKRIGKESDIISALSLLYVEEKETFEKLNERIAEESDILTELSFLYVDEE
jgi:hypothetical protein